MNPTPLFTAFQGLLQKYQHLIVQYSVLSNRHEARLSEIKIRCTLINSSVLVYAETILPRLGKRKYAFQWMNPDGTLLIRWDNAPHHPHIATFPHHRHQNDENNIQESPEMLLDDVLTLISSML